MPFIAAAQPSTSLPYIVKGRIVDSASGMGLELVTITMVESGKAKPLSSSLSHDNGNFELGIPVKQGQLVFSCIGYKTRIIGMQPSNSSFINLGMIQLSATSIELKKVQVETQQKLVERDMDKITYNVAADQENEGLTAIDMLQKIPLVTVDADDNLQLNGGSNYQVLINGKISALLIRNPADLFKTMPASSIKSVEVITTPSAKFDAQGKGGILNIITYKKNLKGYNGSANLGAGTPGGYSSGAFLATQTGSLGLSVQAGNLYQSNPASNTRFFREDNLQKNMLEQMGESKNSYNARYIGGEASYFLSTQDVASISYSINEGGGRTEDEQQAELKNNNGRVTEAYTRQNTGRNKSNGHDVALEYQHDFKTNKEQSLTISYKESQSFNNNTTGLITIPLVNYNYNISNTGNDETGRERNIQADYLQPIKKQTLEMGIKSVTRQSGSSYFYNNLDAITNIFVTDSAQTNAYDYKEHILAAYLSFHYHKNKWGIQAGLRWEQTKLEAIFKTSGSFASPDYSNFIPTIALYRRMKGTGALRLSYTQRIDRPGLYYLNPYVDESDPKNISYGNPAIHATTRHDLNLVYNLFAKRTFINLGISYNFTNNSVQQFTILGSDSIARTSYGNIGRNSSPGCSFSGSTTLFKKWTTNLNYTNNYLRVTGIINGQRREKKGLMHNMAGSVTWRDHGWRLSSSLGYSSPGVQMQARVSGILWNSVSVNKVFFKNKRVGINFSVKNPFKQYRSSFTEIDDPGFYQRRETNVIIRRYNVLVNYNFGRVGG